jgi:hypothetical protein
LNEPVKASEDDLAGDFLLLDLEYPGFQVSPEPSFDDREPGFNQEPELSRGNLWGWELYDNLFCRELGPDLLGKVFSNLP